MVEKWDITIPELTGTQTRRAYLYLPDYYDDDPDARYPVLYMFDMGGEGLGPMKALCPSIGECQDQEWEGVCWGTRGDGRG